MLEGNELEGMIGTAGKYVVDVDAEGTVKAALIYNIEGVEVSINVTVTMLALIEKAVVTSENTVDDKILTLVKMLLNMGK